MYSHPGQQLNLTFTIRANPRPALIKCTDMENNLRTVSLPENFVSLGNDVYEFTIFKEMTGKEDFGYYTCSFANSIGDALSKGYTIQPKGDGTANDLLQVVKFQTCLQKSYRQ